MNAVPEKRYSKAQNELVRLTLAAGPVLVLPLGESTRFIPATELLEALRVFYSGKFGSGTSLLAAFEKAGIV